jgi:hypothetical protein
VYRGEYRQAAGAAWRLYCVHWLTRQVIRALKPIPAGIA